MASELLIKISKLEVPDKESIKQIIHIYQEAYKHDRTFQLQQLSPSLIDQMGETISSRCKDPTSEIIVAETETSNQILGWIALSFKPEDSTQISEEHVLLTQYAFLPDIFVKGRKGGIRTKYLEDLSHKVLTDFKSARERYLPDQHCIISALVVDPSYQRRRVASALLSKAITRSEGFAFPIWVQTPSTYHSLFSKHDFEEISEYQINLNNHIPEPKGKGKNKATHTLSTYTWKFMLRQKPLEKALQAYKSSKVFKEEKEEEERRVDKRRRLWGLEEENKKKSRSKGSAKKSGGPKPEDLLLGGDEQTVVGGEGRVVLKSEPK